MPQHASAAKRVRQGARRESRNRSNITRMKTLIKKVRSVKGKEEAAAALKAATKFLDKLAAKGVIHRNKAANQKSKLTRLVNKIA
ncbi:MAG TPA: 30S ribosomal protein S20 [Bacteroidota bacterium]|nr:30S ribosomal protein S20 [Bacteroidota bacterium]